MQLGRWIVAATALALAGGCQLIGELEKFHEAPGATGGDGGAGEGGQAGGEGGSGGVGGVAPPECPSIVHVDAAAAVGGDGASWTSAINDLQVALERARECSTESTAIWVRAGVYVPGASVEDTFTVVPHIPLLGGFAGTETDAGESDPDSNLTILSGDIGGDDNAAGGILGSVADIVGTNSRHVVTVIGEAGSVPVIDGFVITGGDAGAGTDDGGGVLAEGAVLELSRTQLIANRAAGLGGGLFADENVTLDRVSFLYNEAAHGGGASLSGSTVSLTRSLFAANRAVNGDGGGVHISDSAATLTAVRFTGNESTLDGAGLFATGGAQTLVNCVFAGNVATQNGGGLHKTLGALDLINATVHGNRALAGGGVYLQAPIFPSTFYNSILWRNQATSAPTEPLVGSFGSDGARSDVIVSHSIVDGSFPAGAWTTDAGLDGGNNIDPGSDDFVGIHDPLDPGDAPVVAVTGLGLRAYSAGVNAGDSTAISASEDERGGARIRYGEVDIGAIELGGPCGTRAFVTANAVVSEQGDTWATAFRDLQTALFHTTQCSSTTEIWIAEGIYSPGDKPEHTFRITLPVSLYGGFAGDETVLSERDPAAHPVVLSADINDDDTAKIGGVTMHHSQLVGTNNYHVIYADAAGPVRIDGVTVTAGRANGSGEDRDGAGIFSTAEDHLTVVNCNIIGNKADDPGVGASQGGGIYFVSPDGVSALTMSDCLVAGNGSGWNGGGVYVLDAGPGSMTRVTFQDNLSTYGSGAWLRDTDFSIDASAFIGNASLAHAALYASSSSEPASYTVTRTRFVANEATNSAAMWLTGAMGTHTLEGCLVLGNYTSASTGVITIANATVTMTNTTVAGNRNTGSGPGVIRFSDGDGMLTIENSIFWDNTGSIKRDNNDDSRFLVSSSVMEGMGESGAWNLGVMTDGGGNVAGPPAWVTAPDHTTAPNQVGDLRLLSGSPGIDDGDNGLASVSLDLDGMARQQGNAVDAGCYENE